MASKNQEFRVIHKGRSTIKNRTKMDDDGEKMLLGDHPDREHNFPHK